MLKLLFILNLLLKLKLLLILKILLMLKQKLWRYLLLMLKPLLLSIVGLHFFLLPVLQLQLGAAVAPSLNPKYCSYQKPWQSYFNPKKAHGLV